MPTSSTELLLLSDVTDVEPFTLNSSNAFSFPGCPCPVHAAGDTSTSVQHARPLPSGSHHGSEQNPGSTTSDCKRGSEANKRMAAMEAIPEHEELEAMEVDEDEEEAMETGRQVWVERTVPPRPTAKTLQLLSHLGGISNSFAQKSLSDLIEGHSGTLTLENPAQFWSTQSSGDTGDMVLDLSRMRSLGDQCASLELAQKVTTFRSTIVYVELAVEFDFILKHQAVFANTKNIKNLKALWRAVGGEWSEESLRLWVQKGRRLIYLAQA
ncbi:hypothetical protein FA95DRAFT_1578946, partial [Auriscalpium vulgare]